MQSLCPQFPWLWVSLAGRNYPPVSVTRACLAPARIQYSSADGSEATGTHFIEGDRVARRWPALGDQPRPQRRAIFRRRREALQRPAMLLPANTGRPLEKATQKARFQPTHCSRALRGGSSPSKQRKSGSISHRDTKIGIVKYTSPIPTIYCSCSVLSF